MKSELDSKASGLNRLLVYLADSWFISTLLYVISLSIILIFGNNVNFDRISALTAITLVMLLVQFPLIPLVAFFMTLFKKGSPAKLLCGYRVETVKPTKRAIKIFIREILLKGSCYLIGIYVFIDLMVYLANEGVSLHDKGSRTRVYKSGRQFISPVKLLFLIVFIQALLVFSLIVFLGQKKYAIKEHYEYSTMVKRNQISKETLWKNFKYEQIDNSNQFKVTYTDETNKKISETVNLKNYLIFWWVVDSRSDYEKGDKQSNSDNNNSETDISVTTTTIRQNVDTDSSKDSDMPLTWEEGLLLDTYQTPDGSAAYELRSGVNGGSNYLIDGKTGKSLGIENVVTAAFSTDGRYFIYSLGEYNAMVGQLLPKMDVWVSEVGKTAIKVYELNDFPNSISLASDGKIIIIGTKNSVAKIDIDGTNYKKFYTYTMANTASELFLVPEVLVINDTTVQIKLIDNEAYQKGFKKLLTISFDGKVIEENRI